MSSDELQADPNNAVQNQICGEVKDVTITFFGNRNSIKIKANRDRLVAGSSFFAQHWTEHPRSGTVKAPRSIIPNEAIKQESIEATINYLHGEEIIESDNIADTVELILAARAFGIPGLEAQVTKHLEQKLEHVFVFVGLADAMRGLYGCFREEVDDEVGNEVVSIVTGIAARVCRRRMTTLGKYPEFMQLLKDVPQLALDIIEAVVEEDSEKVVKLEEQASPEDAE